MLLGWTIGGSVGKEGKGGKEGKEGKEIELFGVVFITDRKGVGGVKRLKMF